MTIFDRNNCSKFECIQRNKHENDNTLGPYENLVTLSRARNVTDTVTNATNILSLVTKNSGLVATLATRLLYDLDVN